MDVRTAAVRGHVACDSRSAGDVTARRVGADGATATRDGRFGRCRQATGIVLRDRPTGRAGGSARRPSWGDVRPPQVPRRPRSVERRRPWPDPCRTVVHPPAPVGRVARTSWTAVSRPAERFRRTPRLRPADHPRTETFHGAPGSHSQGRTCGSPISPLRFERRVDADAAVEWDVGTSVQTSLRSPIGRSPALRRFRWCSAGTGHRRRVGTTLPPHLQERYPPARPPSPDRETFHYPDV